MRSLGWLKFRYICKYRLFRITHKATHLGFPEYLAKYIIIQSSNHRERSEHFVLYGSNISSQKCQVVKLAQRSTSLAYSE